MKRYLLIALDALLPAIALVLATLDVIPEFRTARNLAVIGLVLGSLFLTFYLIRVFYYEILLPEPTKSNRNKVYLISVLVVGLVFTLSFVSLFRILIPQSYAEKEGVRELVEVIEGVNSPYRYYIYKYTTKPKARRVFVLLKSEKGGFVMELHGIADFPADTVYVEDNVMVVEQFSNGTSQRFEMD